MGTLKEEKQDQANLENKRQKETLTSNLSVKMVKKPVPPSLPGQGIAQFERKKNKIEAILNEPSVYTDLEECFHLENGPQTLSVKILRDALIEKEINNRFLSKLTGDISELERIYGIGPSIKKDEFGKIRMELIPRKPEYSCYSIKGEELTKMKTPNKEQQSAGAALTQVRPLDQMELIDATPTSGPSRSQFLNLMMELESRSFPVAIKYRCELLNRLLIYVPKGMNVSELGKDYGPQLTRIYEELYVERNRGRRKGRSRQKQRIYEALKDLMGQGIPKYKLAEMAEERLKGKPKAGSIKKRHNDVLELIKKGPNIS